MHRRPLHTTPLVGSATAIALSGIAGVAAFVVMLREGADWALALPTLAFFHGLGLLFAAGLQYADLGLLKVAGEKRPARFERYWRKMWLIVPPLAWVGGALIGSFAQLGA